MVRARGRTATRRTAETYITDEPTVIIWPMIRTQISLTEEQMQRLRREARRRHVSLAAVIRDAVDRVVPTEDAERTVRMERLLAAAGTVASGTGTVARDHDEVLAGDRW